MSTLLIIIKFLLVIGMILGGIRTYNVYFHVKKNRLPLKQVNKNIVLLKSRAPQAIQNKIKYWARISSIIYIVMAVLVLIDAYILISNLWSIPTSPIWIVSIIIFMIAYLFIYSQTKLYRILISIDKLLDTNFLQYNNIFILDAQQPLIITITLSTIFCLLNI